MTVSESAAIHADYIDQAAGLDAAPAIRALRAQRDKVLAGTQGAHDLLLSPDLPGQLSQAERLLVAAYAARLAEAPVLFANYRDRLKAIDAALAELAGHADAHLHPGPARQQALLQFTHTLVTHPVEGDAEALATLQAAGLETPDIVTLAQLIAFLTYQLRVVAGLRAMVQAAEAA
jgi:uncharacterized protein YciW